MKNSFIIKKNHEFQEIINNNSKVKSSSFIIYIKKKEKKHLRYGISVGKRIGNAVARNHIKRQVRIMIYGLLSKYKDLKLDVIFMVRDFYKKKKFEENWKELDWLISIIK